MQEEEIVPFAAPVHQIPIAVQCRGTLLVSSRRALEAHGLLLRYETHLAREHAYELRALVSGQWAPIDLAIAHYAACERLGLTEATQVRLGALVSDRILRTFLGTILKLASQGGVTPWLGVERFGKAFQRVFVGGGVRITKLGPKEARVHIVGLPLAGIPYFRNGYRGVIIGGCERFSRPAHCKIVPRLTSATSLGYAVSWA